MKEKKEYKNGSSKEFRTKFAIKCKLLGKTQSQIACKINMSINYLNMILVGYMYYKFKPEQINKLKKLGLNIKVENNKYLIE